MNAVEKYFNAERFYCAIGIGIGVVAIAFAIYFLTKVKQPFYTGMSYPFILIGLFFLVICTGVFLRSPNDIKRVNSWLEAGSAELQQQEFPRMEKVMRNFKVIMIAEVTLILLSAGLPLFASLSENWKGVCAGVLILATLLLAFDWLADKRGSEYYQFLIEKIRK